MESVVKKNARDILVDYLNQHGIKMSFLADKIGVPNRYVYDRLNGRTKIDADFVIKASKVLGIKPDIFLNKSYSY